jgi:hypothetical protein
LLALGKHEVPNDHTDKADAVVVIFFGRRKRDFTSKSLARLCVEKEMGKEETGEEWRVGVESVRRGRRETSETGKQKISSGRLKWCLRCMSKCYADVRQADLLIERIPSDGVRGGAIVEIMSTRASGLFDT